MRLLSLLFTLITSSMLFSQGTPVLTYIDHPNTTGGRVALNTIQVLDCQACNGGGNFWSNTWNARYFDNLMRMTNENSAGSALVFTASLTDATFTTMKTAMEARGWTITGSTTPGSFTTVASLSAYNLVIIGCEGGANCASAFRSSLQTASFNTALQSFVLNNNGDLIVTGWALDSYSYASGNFLTTLQAISPFTSFTYSYNNNVNSFAPWQYSTPLGSNQVFTTPNAVSWVGAESTWGCNFAISPSTYTLRSGASIIAQAAGYSSTPASPPAAPTINTQPSFTSSSICTGSNSGALSISATGATSYQWQISSNSGSTWTDITGMTGTTFPGMTMNSAGSYQFRCAATNTGGTTNSNVATLTVSGNPTINTQPTTTAIFKCFSNAAQSLTVAVTDNSPSYQWQQSTTSNGTFANVTTGTGGTTASFTPVHSSIGYGGTMYYRCVITGACGSATSNVSAAYTIGSDLTPTSLPSTVDQLYCTGATATALSVNYASSTNWPSLTYQWKESADLTTWANVSSGTGGTTATYTPSTATVGTKYYQCIVGGSCGSTPSGPASGAITVKAGLTWNGSASNDPSTSGNWTTCGSGTGTDFNIPAGVPNYPEYTNLNISAGQTVTVESGARLTVNGILTNDGTLIINSGATLVQGSTSTIAGSGNYIVKQTVSGIGYTTNPSGRFWYLGSPVTTANSSVFFSNLTSSATVLKKRNESTNTWTQIASGANENLVVGKGYYAQIRPVNGAQISQNVPLTFSGTINNNPTSSALTISCTRTTGQGFEGFNLVSNPYPSYLDWDLVTKTNVGNTMWYRTATGTASNTMVFETYVAGAAGGIGTNLSGNVATKLIPPMQAFWVRVNSGNSTGSIVLDNSMRAHFTSISGSTAGLRSTNDELKVFLRMNLLQEDKKDQLIVYMNGAATNGFDILDGEKMMQAGFPQFYTKAADKKIVINGLNSAKKQQALPITMELPTTGVHSFIIEDLEISNGLVWLEDKQEEIIQALEPGTVYEFFANSGMNAERFVLHFQLIDDAVPTNVYNEVNSSANFSGKGANVHAEAAGVVVIKLPASTEGVTDIQIKDAAGKVVYTGSTNTLETSVQLAQANGIYYVTLNSTSGVEVRKVFIQQ